MSVEGVCEGVNEGVCEGVCECTIYIYVPEVRDSHTAGVRIPLCVALCTLYDIYTRCRLSSYIINASVSGGGIVEWGNTWGWVS
jgi:hypothetical protein